MERELFSIYIFCDKYFDDISTEIESSLMDYKKRFDKRSNTSRMRYRNLTTLTMLVFRFCYTFGQFLHCSKCQGEINKSCMECVKMTDHCLEYCTSIMEIFGLNIDLDKFRNIMENINRKDTDKKREELGHLAREHGVFFVKYLLRDETSYTPPGVVEYPEWKNQEKVLTIWEINLKYKIHDINAKRKGALLCSPPSFLSQNPESLNLMYFVLSCFLT